MNEIKLHSLLEQIIDKKVKEISIQKEKLPLEKILKEIEKTNYQKRDFKNSIKRKDKRLSLIAECKKSTPSSGIIRMDYDVERIAEDYYISGYVDALSVLTEKNYFLGDLSHLLKVKQKVPLAVLRKDFIIDEYQIYESIYFQADAILLISTILQKEQLYYLYNKAKELSLDVVVEIHDIDDLNKILELQPEIIGVNNRNLHTFEVNINTTEKLLKYIPKNSVIISESGISSVSDVKYLYDLGLDAILVGSYFMKSLDIKQAVKKLMEF